MVPNASLPMVWRIVNREQAGPTPHSPLGFAILPGEAAVNTLPEGHPLVDFVSYAKYTWAFARRHDAEQRSTSWYDCYFPEMPHTSLDRFLVSA